MAKIKKATPSTEQTKDIGLLEKQIVREHCARVETEIRGAVDDLTIACRTALDKFKAFCKTYDLNISHDAIIQKDTTAVVRIEFDITPEQIEAKEKSNAIKKFLAKEG